MSETLTTDGGGAKAESWFLTDGTPYKGAAFRDAKNKPFGEMDVACGGCRGSGKVRFGRRRFGSCRTCGGKKTTFEQVRIYTQEQIDKKDARRQATRRAAADRAVEKKSLALGRWSAWCDERRDLIDRVREADDEWMNGVLVDGEIYGHLTEPQERALRQKLAWLDAERRACIGSRPVGAEAERMTLDVTCRRSTSFLAKGFGRKRRQTREVFITDMIDDAGNALVSITETFRLAEGDRARITATVKKHDYDRKPWPVTVVLRVKILEHTPAPEGYGVAPLEDDDLAEVMPPLAEGEVVECVDHGAGMNLPF